MFLKSKAASDFAEKFIPENLAVQLGLFDSFSL